MKEIVLPMTERSTPEGLNPTSSVFYFDAQINEQTAASFIDFVRSVNRNDPEKEIELRINSNGGSVQAVLDMVRQMRHVENPVSTIVESRAMSAGALLLACGDPGRRFAYEDAQIMIHQISFPLPKEQMVMGELFDFTREKMRLNRSYFKEMAAATGKDTQELLRMTYNKDLYLTAQQALELGMVDSVLLSPKHKISPIPTNVIPFPASPMMQP